MKLNKQKKKIKGIINAIELDITDRKGLRQEWEHIDEDIKDEIRKTWFQIISNILGDRNDV